MFHWAILIKPDGTVERLPSELAYSARKYFAPNNCHKIAISLTTRF